MARPPPPLNWEINFLTEWWTVPCSVPLIVYFETLYKASRNVVFTLLMFDLFDVVRGYFRPVPNRRWRHGRKGRKGHFKKAFIPELGETVAKWIPGAEPVAGRWVDDGVRWLWTLDSAIQKAFYFIMIFDVIDDFWTDLNSGIITSEAADCEGAGRLMRKGHPAITGPQGWIVMDCDILVYQEGDVFSDPYGCQVGAGQWMAIASSIVTNKGALPAPLTTAVRVRAEANGIEENDVSSVHVLAQHESASCVASMKFNGPAFVAWEGLVIGNEADFAQFQVNVFQIGGSQT